MSDAQTGTLKAVKALYRDWSIRLHPEWDSLPLAVMIRCARVKQRKPCGGEIARLVQVGDNHDLIYGFSYPDDLVRRWRSLIATAQEAMESIRVHRPETLAAAEESVGIIRDLNRMPPAERMRVPLDSLDEDPVACCGPGRHRDIALSIEDLRDLVVRSQDTDGQVLKVGRA